MITAKHAKGDIANVLKTLSDPKATREEKDKAIGKAFEILLKVELSNRLNVVKVMEKLGVEKVKNTPKTEKDEKEI